MLDVIHFLFEEDSRFVSAEEAEALSSLRTSIYRNLYNTTYLYSSSKKKNNSSADSDYFDDFAETKPYIPPTDFNPASSNPYGSLLDAPIG